MLFFLIGAIIVCIVGWSFFTKISSLMNTSSGSGGENPGSVFRPNTGSPWASQWLSQLGIGLGRGVIDVNGREVVFSHTPARKNTPSELRFTLRGDFCAQACFRRETMADGIVRNIGINQEIQLNDPLVDSQLYIECEDKEFIHQFLNAADVKKILIDLFLDFSSLEIMDNCCVLIKTPCESPDRLPADVASAAAAKLVFLSNQIPLPRPGAGSATPVTREVRHLGALVVGIGTGVVILGIILTIYGLNICEPVDQMHVFLTALKFSLFSFVLYAGYVFMLLKGHSGSLKVLLQAFVIGFLGLLALSWGGIATINGGGDISLPQKHTVSVIEKNYSRSKNSVRYYVNVSPWRPGMSDYQFTIDLNLYNRINSGDPCMIRTRKGALGFEWVVSRECQPRR